MKVRKLLSRTRHAILLTFALSAGLLRLQADPPPSPPSATAITEVFGDGLRLTAVAIDFGTTIRSSTLRREDFTVPGRTIAPRRF